MDDSLPTPLETITPPTPQQVAAIQFIKSISDRMFAAGKIWVNDEHAVAIQEHDVSGKAEILEKLGSGVGTPSYELASRLSAVLGIKCRYMHNQGTLLKGKIA